MFPLAAVGIPVITGHSLILHRVVTISDLAAHLPLPLGAAAAGSAAVAGGGGWEPWSGHDPVAALEGPEAALQRRNALLGLLAEVCDAHLPEGCRHLYS
jgi:ABC-type uncharacterized transport system permease subunit